MSYAVFSILAPAIINEAVAELEVDNESLQTLFDCPIGGGNVKKISGRNFGWDVFNPTREVAAARAPGVGPSTNQNQPVDSITGRFPRVHEKQPLLYEEVHNQRRIGGPPSDLDLFGLDYITEQEKILKQRVVNHREFMLAAMLRGSYTYSVVGQDLLPAFSGGQISISFQIPSGNIGNTSGGSFSASALNPNGTTLIPTAWSNTAAAIDVDLYSIDKAMKILTGKRLRHVICNSSVWTNVQQNTNIRNLAGSANVVFDRLEKVDDGSEDFTAVLRGIPWVLWHINNEVLNLQTTVAGTIGGSVTQMIPDNCCFFLPKVDPTWIQMWAGSEVVVEWIGRPGHEEFDAYFYATPTANPAGYELVSLMNCIPALKNAKAVMSARVQ